MKVAAPPSQTSERIVVYDLLRSIAIISIVWAHAIDTAFANYGLHDVWYWVPMRALGHIGVPFFWIISGALLLPRSYPHPFNFYKRRVLQFIAMIIVVSVSETWISNILRGQ